MTQVATPIVVDRPQWWTRALTAGGVVGAMAVVTAGDGDDGIVLCPFRVCTGGYCPGCGGTRAAGRLLRGDVVGAWQRHPFVVLLAAQLAILAGLYARASSRPWVRARWATFTIVNTGIMVAVWLLRLGLDDVPRPF